METTTPISVSGHSMSAMLLQSELVSAGQPSVKKDRYQQLVITDVHTYPCMNIQWYYTLVQQVLGPTAYHDVLFFGR